LLEFHVQVSGALDVASEQACASLVEKPSPLHS
jgi:hypothetical protein